jgi:AraC-like DNA-binding protein
MRTENKTGEYSISENNDLGLRLCFQKFHDRSYVPLFRCDEPVIILPQKGTYCMRAHKQVFTVKQGELLLMQSKDQMPLEDVAPGTEVFVFTLPYIWYKHYGRQPLEVTPAVYKPGDELYLRVMELYNQFLLDTPDALIEMDIILPKIVRLLYREQLSNAGSFKWEAKFEALKEMLCRKMKSPRLLASELGVEYRQFLKEFKQVYGCTLKAFPNKKKLKEAAAMLLADRTKDIKYISDSLGFPDPGTFNREFKKEFNKTPGDYRRDNPPA